jgi:predicted MFS family arabinose efflux permease
VLRSGPALALLAVAFLSALPWSIWGAFVVFFFQSTFALDQGAASVLVLTSGAGILLGSQISGRLGDRLGHRPVLLVSLFGGCVAIFAITHAPVPLIGAAALNTILAAFAGSRVVGQASLISEALPSARGTLLAAMGSILSASTVVGGSLGGVLIDAGGFGVVGVVAAACYGAAALCLMLVRDPSTVAEAGQESVVSVT